MLFWDRDDVYYVNTDDTLHDGIVLDRERERERERELKRERDRENAHV